VFPRFKDPELIHLRVTKNRDPLGVMRAKEKSAKNAQGTLRKTGAGVILEGA